MPNDNEGVKVAQRLDKLKKPPRYLFLTAYDEYMSDGYEVFADGYLLKPINQEDFNRNILRVMKKILTVSPRIVIEYRDGLNNVYTDSIMYIELIGRKSKITLEDGRELITDKTIEFWTNQLIQLASENFNRLSQSCIINFQHIDAIALETREITMDDDRKFKVPVRKVKEVKNAFYDYLEGEI